MRSGIVIALLAAAVPASAESSPPVATEPRSGSMSIGIGESFVSGPVGAIAEHYTLGARFTDRDWVTASFGRPRAVLLDGYSDVRFWELAVGANRMFCHPGSVLCFAVGLGVGFQSAGYTYVYDLPSPEPMPDVVTDSNSVFGEGKIALRLNLNYVWLEGAFAIREHVLTDSESAGDTLSSGMTLGVALHITP